MKKIGKYLAIGVASLALANPLLGQENLEVKTRICDGFPMTVLTKDNIPTHRIVNVSLNGVEPKISPYLRDPMTFNAIGGPERTQSCHYVESDEQVQRTQSDILPEDIYIEDGKVYFQTNGRSRELKFPGGSE
jgi:hypothetical protein